jgi:hypothetical protein
MSRNSGTIALSLLLARTVTLEDFEQRLPGLLDEFSAMAAATPSAFAAPLRVWLEHALQIAPHSYRSAADAQEGLKELPASTRDFSGHLRQSPPCRRKPWPRKLRWLALKAPVL